jgi:hypothetical protein
MMMAIASSVAFEADATTDKTLQKVVTAGDEINQSASKSQQKIDNINDQIQSKLQQFKTVNKEVDGLKVYNSQLAEQIKSQVLEVEQLNNSIDNVSVIERQITPLMQRMIETLTTFVELDVPFLTEERSKRIKSLTDMMLQADVAVSEKFRRVLEAYQVEMDYGRTIEAYSGMLAVEGQERDVDFLRIGRVGLMYQTRDGAYQGSWNQQSKQWDMLPSTSRIHISKGLRIARKQLAPDLLTVPLTAPL